MRPIVDLRARPSLCPSVPPPLAPCVHHGLGSCTRCLGTSWYTACRSSSHDLADDLVWLGGSQHHDLVGKWKEFPYGCRLPRRGVSFCWGTSPEGDRLLLGVLPRGGSTFVCRFCGAKFHFWPRRTATCQPGRQLNRVTVWVCWGLAEVQASIRN